MSGYEKLKELKRSLHIKKVTDLLVLAPQNDPYYAGTATQVLQAEWFANLWDRFGYTTGIHLRRVHYQLVSQRDPLVRVKADGLPYENTEADWGYLQDASRMARYLGLVAPEAFEDHRNPDPHLLAPVPRPAPTPQWFVDEPYWRLPEIDDTRLTTSLYLRVPTPTVYGYDYELADQGYLLELWAEKSTMDDVLIPVCRELGVNLITSLGFQSITSVVKMIKNRVELAARLGRPTRIFYISDHDPAGDSMPVAVARQIQFWIDQYAPDGDVALTPLALTREQVERYTLPRIPVKDTDLRKANFEALHGEGATELDALEALYPGELARIVREAVAPYRDRTLARRLVHAESEAQDVIDAAWDQSIAQYQAALDEIQREASEIADRYQGELSRLSEQMASEIEPLQERLDLLRQAIENESTALTVQLPLRPQPEPFTDTPGDWLYRSDRDYLAQVAVFKARRNGNGPLSAGEVS